MKTLMALKGHSYGNKFHYAGDLYEARDDHAKLMVLLKNSEYYVEEPPVVVPPPKVEPEKTKRPYVRRNLASSAASGYATKDMKAE